MPRNIPTEYDRVTALFEEAARVDHLEAKGQLIPCRCTSPITGAPQMKCDLPVFPAEQLAQSIKGDMSAEPVRDYLCRVHANPGPYRAVGINPAHIYRNSPYAVAFQASNQTKLTA